MTAIFLIAYVTPEMNRLIFPHNSDNIELLNDILLCTPGSGVNHCDERVCIYSTKLNPNPKPMTRPNFTRAPLVEVPTCGTFVKKILHSVLSCTLI